MLHPRHKLSYFKSAGWTPEWIETAEELVRTVFQGSYASHSVVDDTRDAREAQETDKVRVGTVLCILTVNHLSLARHLFPLSRPSSNCLSTLQHAQTDKVRVGTVLCILTVNPAF